MISAKILSCVGNAILTLPTIKHYHSNCEVASFDLLQQPK